MAHPENHSAFLVADVHPWVLYVSHRRARRLIVFVHGFRGHAVTTWTEFGRSGRVSTWWMESDMLFVGYASTRDNITSVADRLNTELPRFYPRPFPPAMNVGGVAAREDVQLPYEELILVGHSLGGLIIRCALAQAAQDWLYALNRSDEPPHVILTAQTRLFSPASAGFRPAGFLAVVKGAGVWPAIELFLRMSSAYTDLQPGSSLIADTRRRTERLFERTKLSALQARTLWANPDEVVLAEIYETDSFRASVDGQSHGTVCKPRSGYRRPWYFVEKGR
ncbi:alpha/beta fold hydrolase [Arthrobacter sp. MDT1-65]